jgi:putative ABC transport system substrate-binding protein
MDAPLFADSRHPLPRPHHPLRTSRPSLPQSSCVVAGLAVSNRQSEFARDGGLLSYGPDVVDLFRRAASYVDRILRGAKPGDLPVQFPTKFEMAVNLKTAKALGLTIPETLLATADEVIQ